jgi:hypothetical protein
MKAGSMSSEKNEPRQLKTQPVGLPRWMAIEYDRWLLSLLQGCNHEENHLR